MALSMKNAFVLLLVCLQMSQACAFAHGPMTILGTQGYSIAADFKYESWEDVIRVIHIYAPEFKESQGEFKDNPFLGKQQYGLAPNFWIQLNMTGWGQDYTEALLRRDNLYVVSLTTRKGARLATTGHHKWIDGSITLSFGETYSDLLSVKTQGFKELHKLVLGKEELLSKIHVASEFDPADPAGDDQLKSVVAVFSVMFSEAARITPIYEQIRDTWPHPTTITEDMAKFSVNWGPMSHLLFCHYFGRPWGGKRATKLARETKVFDAAGALKTVSVILWPESFDPFNLDKVCK